MKIATGRGRRRIILLLVPSDHRTNDWDASEVHDWGVPPPPDSAWDPFGSKYASGDVTYDLGFWTSDQCDTLMLGLDENDIPYQLDGRFLTVAQDDESYVDTLVAGEALPTEDELSDEPSASDVARYGLLIALEALGESL